MDRKTINQASSFLGKRRLAKAITCMMPIMEDTAYAVLHDRLNNIQREYQFMQEYMKKGVADPARDRLYVKLLKRMHRVVADADIIWLTANDIYMRDAKARMSSYDITLDDVRHHLEGFVSDVAMLQFSQNENEAEELYQKHADYMTMVFDHLILSKQWSEGEAMDYEALLSSPTIESNDAAHLVSALTLSCYTHFDIRKFRTLIAIYEKSSDPVVQQRALVGWALSLRGNSSLYPEIKEMIDNVCANDNTVQQLVEMQTQLFFCLNAEHDNDEIQREILPTLMRNNNFEITRWGITEKEDTTLEGILHPDAEEKAMEMMEKTFQRMQDMQNSGSDIYFGGFSQMKRLPFFYNWSNWFCPFYIKHPALANTIKKLGNTALLSNLFENGPFCDSDKYSFAIAMSSVVDRLPNEVKSMLGNDEAFGPTEHRADMHSVSSIRQMYLQDLYRFFRLCDRRRPFRNPFDGQDGVKSLFIASSVLVGTNVEKHIVRLGKFLLKHNRVDALMRLLDTFDTNGGNADLLTLKAAAFMRRGQMENAIELLRKVHHLAPDMLKSYAMLGRCLMIQEKFDEAATIYTSLHEKIPENRGYFLNKCIAMVNCGNGEEVIAELYKLTYDHSEDTDAIRVLAWGLLSCGKIQQAEREYSRLLNQENPIADDYLNSGYCEWISGKIEKALDLFKNYMGIVRSNDHHATLDMAEVFQRDSVMLQTNGLTISSIYIMADMVE